MSCSPVEKHVDTLAELLIEVVQPELRQTRYGSRTHGRVLKHDTVIDESDVLGRVRRLGALDTQQVEHTNREFCELAVLDELTQVRERLLLALPDELDHVEDGFDDRALKVVSALVAQDARQEREHRFVLGRELEAERADGVDDDDLELIADLAHEAADLLHEAIDGRLIAGLKQRRNSVGRNTAVRVRDKVLEVDVASRDALWVRNSESSESPGGGELERGLR